MSDDEGDYADDVADDAEGDDFAEADDIDLDDIEEEAEVEEDAELEGDDEVDESEAEDNSTADTARPTARLRVDPILQTCNSSIIVTVVPDNERITSNVLQLPEAARVIAVRAAQIAKYPTVFVDIGGETDCVALARKELLLRRCPLILRRILRCTAKEMIIEKWAVREMTLPDDI
jgi:DNA-directed RNA polymerase subunit K/omega